MHGIISNVNTAHPLIPASFPLGRAWFLVCCYGRREDEVASEIKPLGFPTFNPKMSRTVIRRGRRTVIHSNLFPGYIFTSFDRERDDWGTINTLDGVIEVMTNLNMPMRVPDIDIERLRQAEQAGIFDLTNPSANFKLNEEVEIMEGPFVGLIARIKSATAKKRVKILFEELAATITIDPVFLRKLSG